MKSGLTVARSVRHWYTKLLIEQEDVAGLVTLKRGLIAEAEAVDAPQRVAADPGGLHD